MYFRLIFHLRRTIERHYDLIINVMGGCLARHVRRTRIADIAIIHFKTSFVGYRGRGMTHIYRSLAGEACLAR